MTPQGRFKSSISRLPRPRPSRPGDITHPRRSRALGCVHLSVAQAPNLLGDLSGLPNLPCACLPIRTRLPGMALTGVN